jgi:gluconolactonase
MKLLVLGALLFSLQSFAIDDYKPGPDSVEQPGVPRGKVTKGTFSNSKIFPGTVRDYWVYVPEQLDRAKPAPQMIFQDGLQYKAPIVFDNLIHRKEVPALVGVFVMHGRVPALSTNALDRYNRSHEYDGLGPDYARFLLEELLPFVAKEHNLNLSTNGNDRAIAGASSGAICAFTAAWERPDAFSRVFSSIGTFVDQQGGNTYPALIRRFEPKPLRVYLQDGSNDADGPGGNWFLANQEMLSAFEFSGYEVNHVWGDGRHSSIHATAIFPDALRWLWKDWPTPVKQGEGSGILRGILIPGEEWQLVGEGYKFTEGPAVNAAGEVFYNDVPESKTYKVGTDGRPSVFLSETKKGDGQAFGPDGRLYSVAGGEEKIIAYDPRGQGKQIAEGFRGNDLAVRHDGLIYVTHPGWDGVSPSKLWLVKPNGDKQVVDTGLRFSNGLTLSPDHSLLYVADTRTHWVYSYQIQPDGTLAHKQKYFHLNMPDTADDAGPDGMRVDREGRLYVATRLGIQVCDQAGRVNAIIPTPNGKVSNLCFGGPDQDVIYATCGDKVYKRKVKVKGAQGWAEPNKPAAPRL